MVRIAAGKRATLVVKRHQPAAIAPNACAAGHSKVSATPAGSWHEVLALAKAAVFTIRNPKFGPEVEVDRPKVDISVTNAWLSEVRGMVVDLRARQVRRDTPSTVLRDDSCDLTGLPAPKAIDAVITSPPESNERA